jgi:hypothetical protein
LESFTRTQFGGQLHPLDQRHSLGQGNRPGPRTIESATEIPDLLGRYRASSSPFRPRHSVRRQGLTRPPRKYGGVNALRACGIEIDAPKRCTAYRHYRSCGAPTTSISRRP